MRRMGLCHIHIHPSQKGPGRAVLDCLSPFMMDHTWMGSVAFGFTFPTVNFKVHEGKDLTCVPPYLPQPVCSPVLTHGSCLINICWMLSTALGWSPGALAWLLRSCVEQSDALTRLPPTLFLVINHPVAPDFFLFLSYPLPSCHCVFTVLFPMPVVPSPHHFFSWMTLILHLRVKDLMPLQAAFPVSLSLG